MCYFFRITKERKQWELVICICLQYSGTQDGGEMNENNEKCDIVNVPLSALSL